MRASLFSLPRPPKLGFQPREPICHQDGIARVWSWVKFSHLKKRFEEKNDMLKIDAFTLQIWNRKPIILGSCVNIKVPISAVGLQNTRCIYTHLRKKLAIWPSAKKLRFAEVTYQVFEVATILPGSSERIPISMSCFTSPSLISRLCSTWTLCTLTHLLKRSSRLVKKHVHYLKNVSSATIEFWSVPITRLDENL